MSPPIWSPRQSSSSLQSAPLSPSSPSTLPSEPASDAQSHRGLARLRFSGSRTCTTDIPASHRSARARGSAEPSLEDFVARDDLLYHGTLPSLAIPNDAMTRLDLDKGDEQPATPNKAARLTPSSDAPPSPTPSPARQLTPIPSPELSRKHPESSTASSADSSASDRTLAAAANDDTTLAAILPLAHLTLPNPYPCLAPFLSSFSLPILSELLRPSWDTYFMLLASLASLRSNCMKRRVGAVLVREKRVVSTGYNGTPRGVRNCGEGGCGRCNSHGDGWGDDQELGRTVDDVFSNGDGGGGGERRPAANGTRNLSRIGEALDECLCLHAEENALLEAGRERVSGGGTEGAVLYCNTCVSSPPRPVHLTAELTTTTRAVALACDARSRLSSAASRKSFTRSRTRWTRRLAESWRKPGSSCGRSRNLHSRDDCKSLHFFCIPRRYESPPMSTATWNLGRARRTIVATRSRLRRLRATA